MKRTRSILAVFGTLGAAVLSGLAALALHIPAGGIIGPLLALGGFNIATGRLPQLPTSWRRLAMVLTGTVIGSGVGPHLIDSIARFWPSALAMTAWIISSGFLLGWIISRRTGVDLPTALLCFAPGGVGDMAVVAQDLGADARLVTMVGLLRVVLTILVVPLVLGYLVLRH